MKFKATYYDYETGKMFTKNCIAITYETMDKSFSFTPVDDPVRFYKAVTIDHPRVSVYQNDCGIKIIVDGYQCMKEGGYWRTTTVIESVTQDFLLNEIC
jgi:hypothetical protein